MGSYGSSQPALKPLSVFGGTPAGSPSALTAGDVLYVGSNKCTITAVFGRGGVTNDDFAQSAGSEDTNAVMGDEISGVTCAETLTADAHSSSDAIAVNEPVEIQIGGATTSCYATDMRAIRFQNGDPATQSSVKIATINNANRQVTQRLTRIRSWTTVISPSVTVSCSPSVRASTRPARSTRLPQTTSLSPFPRRSQHV